MSDQPVAEATTCTIQNKHKIRTSMPSAESELAIPATEWLQIYTLDCVATGISNKFIYYVKITYNYPAASSVHNSILKASADFLNTNA